jgi:hypothetical protein
MCGGMRLGFTSYFKFEVISGRRIPSEYVCSYKHKGIVPSPMPPFSSHRFVRIDKVFKAEDGTLNWRYGNYAIPLTLYQLEVAAFRERDKWFMVSDHDLRMIGAIHQDVSNRSTDNVFSIITTEASKNVRRVHHRMPVFRQVWITVTK